ncbi:MAG TPA: choice-of-anchor Q domain-containing protein [Pyrinomonadaceae bacterium]|nr:choice-of-anchor Q domain-containing protein [Pyrinomonadaceae bacterium]
MISLAGLTALKQPRRAGAQQLVPPLHLKVNSLADAPDINHGDGICDSDGGTTGEQCTFRAAIQEANAWQVAGSDTILFDPALNQGTISLSTALPDIATNLIVDGPGANLLRIQRSTAGGTPNFRVLKIRPDLGPSVTVSIYGLTFSNGHATGASFETESGGGIWNRGTLTLDSCVVTGNQADIGAGIVNLGALTIRRTTIANNTATDVGGGIANMPGEGTSFLQIDSSTISGNTTATQGGGIFNSGLLTLITNSTISSNNAFQGAGISNLSHLQMNGVTLAANSATGNSGGIRNSGVVVFTNTIIAGNTAPAGPDGAGLDFGSLDYNLIGDTNGMQISGSTAHNITNVNARLGPLAHNGGLTQTHELLDGSPAIDVGLSSLLTDQRGSSRPVDNPAVTNAAGGNASDIGAYETPVFEVNSIADTDDGACTLAGAGNGCTLREAIFAANTTLGAETITFKAALTASGPATITLLSALPELDSDMTMVGPGRDLLTIQRTTAPGTPSFRIFTIHAAKAVELSDLTIANGNAITQNNGGGVRNNGALTMRNCNVYGNKAGTTGVSGLGGGIYMDGSQMTLIDTNVGGTGPGQGNMSGAAGGGIFIEHGVFRMTRGSIRGNTGGGGGGITARAATHLDSVAITDNVEVGNGGAGVLVLGDVTSITNSLIANNTANGGDGGGILSGLGITRVTNSTISGNRSISAGGGVYNFNGQTTLVNVTVTGNRGDSDGNGSAFQNGGGTAGTLSMHNSIVAGNSSGPNASPVPNDATHAPDQSSSFNLIGVCIECGLINGANNNQLGVSDAGLGPLADNGGPTLTHALLPGSPALDAGSNAVIQNALFGLPQLLEQRGFNRIVDGPDGNATATVDTGAFEQQASLAEVVNATTNEDTELIVPFHIGDRSGVTSITATSSNPTLVPNHSDHLRVTDAGTTELIRINSATNLNGTTDITITVNTTSGSSSRTFQVTVNPVNDAPSFERRLVNTSSEDAGLVSIPNFALNLSAGPPDEVGQSVSFQVVGNSNPALFSSRPAIDASGTLSYTSTLNAHGSAVILVVMKDNGGTANGGEDTSQPQSFTIVVEPVDDAPLNVVPAQQSVIENSVLTFSSINSNRISIFDVDASTGNVRVTLIANNGTLTLATTAGLTFTTGDGTADTTMRFGSTIAGINTALHGMTFTPTPGFSGFATLQIVTEDIDASPPPLLPAIDFLTIGVLEGGTLQFTSPSYQFGEDFTTAIVTVQRLTGFAGTTSVNFATSNGTATGGTSCGPGIDYVSTSGTLSWTNNEVADKTFSITICDDSDNEETETINLTLTGPTGSGALGTPATSVWNITNNDAPVLLVETGQRAVALDSVIQTRDPFSLLTLFNFSSDQRRRVSLFVWRLGLLPGDTAANITATAEDDEGRVYPLTVEHVGSLPEPAGVVQINVILPQQVIGAPRDLGVKVQLRGPASNKGFIKIL